MASSRFIRGISLGCAAVMLAACNGEGNDMPAAAAAPSSVPVAAAAPSSVPAAAAAPSSVPVAADAPATQAMPETLPAPDTPGNPARTMAGFPNPGAICFANSAWKFLIHSFEPQRLKTHLTGVAADGDALQRQAAMDFIALIESSYSETGPTAAQLLGYLAGLQKLPAFSTLDGAGKPDFPLDMGQDANEFIARLSESFRLHQLHGNAMALQDDNNAFNTDEEYWTILKPVSEHDSLQDLFDRTKPEDWRVTPGENLRQLTVAINNAVEDEQGPRLLANFGFDFHRTVRLEATDARSGGSLVITLEPRTVLEYAAGHYLVHTRDGQWFQHNDALVYPYEQIPAIEHVRLIHFAVVKVESAA